MVECNYHKTLPMFFWSMTQVKPLCVVCCYHVCTFGGMGESLGAQRYEKGWHSLSAK